jgi:cytochrome c oxidase accessory protein FixG
MEIDNNDEFRDTIATVDGSGKRIWLYPQKPSGAFHNKRIIVSIVLLTMLFAAPFIKVGGEPLFLFNLFERKFIVLGKIFLPQDFHLFVLGMLLFFVFVILFTVVYGRIWCGWACPQTIFMEMVFRKIEYWLEGDAGAQRKMDKEPMNSNKITRKISKHFIFILLSFLIGNLMLSYLVGVDRLSMLITHPPKENLSLFGGVIFFSALFYFNFSRFREQACIAVCPYGRLQGVLLGKESINIVYDFVRGEPRGRISNKKDEAEKPKGDCIDCKLCVRVCPTGIDIRNGTQMECVNCTACIDACDQIMDKVGKPHGLIRYASQEEVETKKPFHFNLRMKAYTAVLGVLLLAIGFLLIQREKIETTVLRSQGTTFIKLPNDVIRNMYSFQIANKSNEKMNVTFKLKSPKGKLELAGGEVSLEPQKIYSGAFVVDLEKADIKGMKTPLEIEIYAGSELLETVTPNFVSPFAK